MPTLYMLVGVPGSGKSTWLNNNKSENGVVVSSDDHVERLAAKQGQTYSQAFDAVIGQASSHMQKDLRDAVKAEKDIYWDQTNIGANSRKKKLKQIPNTYRKVAVFFPTPDDAEHERRLASRPGKTIPSHVIKSMANNLQVPSKEEGFDSIVVAS